jgi:hypothetical protein
MTNLTAGGDGASMTDRPAAAYSGVRTEAGAVVVWIAADGSSGPLPPRFDLRNHSPTGFEWGYGGSGPAQLALAILANALGDARAEGLYEAFKWDCIAMLGDAPWTITREQVLSWLALAAQSDEA